MQFLANCIRYRNGTTKFMGVPLLGELDIRTMPVRKLSVLALAAALLLCGTACGQAQEPTSASTNGALSVPEGHVLTEQQVTQLNESIYGANPDEGLVIAEARPSYRMNDGTITMMDIKDESNANQGAGTYTLLVHCTGTGNLDISFTMGDQTGKSTLQCGTTDISSTTVTLDVADTKRSVVEIEPSAGAKSEIAYRIDKER